MKRIVSYISDPLSFQGDDKDAARYPYISCELLYSNVWQITNAVCSDPDLLSRLYGFLLSEAPVHNKSACLCLKVIFSFLDHNPSDVTFPILSLISLFLKTPSLHSHISPIYIFAGSFYFFLLQNISFLKGIQGIVDKFVNKIRVSEVSRLLVKLISCSNETDFANSSFSKVHQYFLFLRHFYKCVSYIRVIWLPT